MRQERERNPNFSPPVNRPAVRGGGARASLSRAPQTTNDVVYLSRDEQRAAAAKREEDAAWRLAREPIAEFHGKAQKGEPFPPSACRELLNALSEPPFAEGRLAPNARKAFETVAGPPKSTKRADAEVEGMVRGVINPLYHLLSHGVSVPGEARVRRVRSSPSGCTPPPPSSYSRRRSRRWPRATPRRRRWRAPRVSSSCGEQVAAKLSGKAPGGGEGRSGTFRAGGRVAAAEDRGRDRNPRRRRRLSPIPRRRQTGGHQGRRWRTRRRSRPQAQRRRAEIKGTAGSVFSRGLRPAPRSVAEEAAKARAVPKVVIHRPFSQDAPASGGNAHSAGRRQGREAGAGRRQGGGERFGGDCETLRGKGG